MSGRTYEEAAQEYEPMSFFLSVQRFSACFNELSLGDLMALGGKFLELAYRTESDDRTENESADAIARAINEVIVFRLKANPTALKRYTEALCMHEAALQGRSS